MQARIRHVPLAAGVLSLLLLLHPSTDAAAQTSTPVTVSGQANIYGAGHATPPAPGGNGGGALPTLVALPSGAGRVVTVSSATGVIDFGACCVPNGPDGIASAGNAADNDWDGIAGHTISRGRFLSGVFLDDTEPADPPPARLSIPDIAFGELQPALRQTFFIGDGLTGTGSGTPQLFHAPAGATRLFLGVHDAGPPDESVPGWYGDNSGSFGATVTVEVADLPAVPATQNALLALLLLAAGLVGVRWTRRSARAADFSGATLR